MLRFIRKTEPPNAQKAASLAEGLGISQRAAELLLCRGLAHEEEAYAFLHPSRSHLCDPFLLKNMDKAAACAAQAVKENRHIVIFGDYDADGVCATATLLLFLRSLRAKADYLIPSRHEEGYGMSMQSAARLADMGAELVITVDNGVKSATEIARCYELGMKVIVTDHHIPGDELPVCEALVLCGGEDAYPNRHICGAGLALKLVEAIAGKERAMEYISLAAVATVADIVPLTGENRAIVALGLQAVNEGRAPIGLSALMEVSGNQSRAFTPAPVNEGHIAFRIAPRLNAAGRIEDAGMAVELLTEADPARAKELAQTLNALNERRRGEEAAIVEEACAIIDAEDITARRAIVLHGPKWNAGIVGIAASKLAERYYRPVVLLTGEGDTLTGSARSIPGVNLHGALEACEELFLRFGGHAFAAGLTIEAARTEEFRSRLEEALLRDYAEETFLPAVRYDFETELSGVTARLVGEIAMLAPFGAGNPAPVLRTDGVRLANLERMGGGKHLRMTATKGEHYTKAVYFGAGDRFPAINELDRCDIVYEPGINDYFRQEELQLQLRRLRPAAPAEPDAWLARRQGNFVDAFAHNVMYNRIRSTKGVTFAEETALARRFLSESAMGALILCLTPAGASRFLSFLAAEGLWPALTVSFTANEAGPCAYNAAVLAPVLDKMDVSRFRRVLFFDTAVSAGLYEETARRAPNAALFAGIPREGEAEPLLLAMPCGRERMGALYKAILRTPGRFYNRAAMLDSLAAASGAPRWECALAADVFSELGFVATGKDGIRVARSPAARELGESQTYQTLASLAGAHEHYMHLYEEARHEP